MIEQFTKTNWNAFLKKLRALEHPGYCLFSDFTNWYKKDEKDVPDILDTQVLHYVYDFNKKDGNYNSVYEYWIFSLKETINEEFIGNLFYYEDYIYKFPFPQNIDINKAYDWYEKKLNELNFGKLTPMPERLEIISAIQFFNEGFLQNIVFETETGYVSIFYIDNMHFKYMKKSNPVLNIPTTPIKIEENYKSTVSYERPIRWDRVMMWIYLTILGVSLGLLIGFLKSIF